MRAIFSDRDGVINVDYGYVYKWEYFHFFPGVPEALASLKKEGWLLILVTNQSGIARGFYSEEAFYELSAKMQSYLRAKNAEFDAIYHCPHLPDAVNPKFSLACRCRKPQPEMFQKAKDQFKISMAQSVCIGDKPTDVKAAKLAGVGYTYGVGSAESFKECPPNEVFTRSEDALLSALRLHSTSGLA